MEIFKQRNLKRLAVCVALPLVTGVGCAPPEAINREPVPKSGPTPAARTSQSLIRSNDGYYITRVNDQTLFIGTTVSGSDGYGMAYGISYLREHGCVIGAISPVSGGNLVDSANCLTNELK